MHLTKFNISKKCVQGTHLNIIKGHIRSPVNILNSEKLKSFSSKIRNKTNLSTLTNFIQYSIGSIGQNNKARKEIKRYPNQKGRSEIVTICRWHNTIIKTLHEKNSGIINSVKFQDMEISIQLSVVVPYTSNIRRELRKIVPFTITSKRIKYMGINLTKERI